MKHSKYIEVHLTFRCFPEGSPNDLCISRIIQSNQKLFRHQISFCTFFSGHCFIYV